jgi:hypothetical protein
MRLILLIAVLMTAAMIALSIWIGTSIVGGGRPKRLPRLRQGGGTPTSLVVPAVPAGV